MKSFLVIAAVALGILVVAGGIIFFGDENRETEESVAAVENGMSETDSEAERAGESTEAEESSEATGATSTVANGDALSQNEAMPAQEDEGETASVATEEADGVQEGSTASSLEQNQEEASLQTTSEPAGSEDQVSLDEGESRASQAPTETESEAAGATDLEARNPDTAEPVTAEPDTTEPETAEPATTAEGDAQDLEGAPSEVVEPGSATSEQGSRDQDPEGTAESTPVESEQLASVGEASKAVSGNGAEKVLPSFDVVRVERDGSVVAAGRAAPGSQVNILADGQEVASVEADQRGEWVFVPSETLLSGDHELSLSSVSGNGEQLASRDVVVVSVPEGPTRTDSETRDDTQVTRESGSDEQVSETESQGDDETVKQVGTRPLAVLMPREGEGETRVLQGPEGGLIAGELSLDSITYDENGQLLASGQLNPGERVFMYIDDRFMGEARANDAGRWQIRPERSLEGGKYTIRVDQVDEQGDVVARLETPFVREEISSDQVEGSEVVVVQPGNSLWRLARRSYGRGVHYTVIYEANDDQIQDPDLIYPGQVFVVPGLEDGPENESN